MFRHQNQSVSNVFGEILSPVRPTPALQWTRIGSEQVDFISLPRDKSKLAFQGSWKEWRPDDCCRLWAFIIRSTSTLGLFRVWRFGFETYRFQNFSILKMVSDSKSDKFGLKKKTDSVWKKIILKKRYEIGYWKNLVSEKSFGFGLVQIFLPSHTWFIKSRLKS